MDWMTIAILIAAAAVTAYLNAEIRALKNALVIAANSIDRLEAKVDQITAEARQV